MMDHFILKLREGVQLIQSGTFSPPTEPLGEFQTFMQAKRGMAIANLYYTIYKYLQCSV